MLLYLYRISEDANKFLSFLPADTAVCERLAVGELFRLCRFLTACDDKTFEHYTRNKICAALYLPGNIKKCIALQTVILV